MENQVSAAPTQRKRLITRNAWIVIVVLSLLLTIGNPVRGEDIYYLAGRLIGSMAVLGAAWALTVTIARWVFRRSRKA